MQYLKKVVKNSEISIYELLGEHQNKLKRYVFSTKQTRDICNKPELVGYEFTRSLKQAIALALKHCLEAEKIKNFDQRSVNVVNFLRGGLNFGLRDALNEAFGFNEHTSSFMTSQRDRDENGRWFIIDDQYRKIKIPKGANLFIGDIVATGSTIKNGLEVVYNMTKDNSGSVKNIFFFTIGCHKVEKILQKYEKLFKQEFDDFEGIYVFYIEGKFHLADSKTDVKINIPGTDLLRYPCVVAPEFELSQYDDVAHALERCTIYDGGSRSFDLEEYDKDLRDYWSKVKELAENGFTLYDALKERWPEKEYADFEEFVKAKKEIWKDIDDEFLKILYEAYTKRWNDKFLEKSKTKEALAEVCDKRLEKFNQK